jgi:SAM-dependent methyltransferase
MDRRRFVRAGPVTLATMSTYVFDQTWQREHDRLTALEFLFDSASHRHLAALGVQPGWRCLEIGAGAGGIARWLADQVGDAGQVLATDLDTRFLQDHGRSNLDVLTHDIVSDPLDGAFDLIHARAVLTHLPARDKVLDRLVAALRPGGRLLIEDVDFGPSASKALAAFTAGPPSAVEAMERVYLGIAAVFSLVGADPSIGNRLPAMLSAAGLTGVGAEIHAPVPAGGTETWTRGSIEQLADKMIAIGPTTAADVELFLALTADPSVYYAPPLMVSAWGQRNPSS